MFTICRGPRPLHSVASPGPLKVLNDISFLSFAGILTGTSFITFLLRCKERAEFHQWIACKFEKSLILCCMISLIPVISLSYVLLIPGRVFFFLYKIILRMCLLWYWFFLLSRSSFLFIFGFTWAKTPLNRVSFFLKMKL